MTNEAQAVAVTARSAERRFDVVFVLPHMGRGGSQRVISLVANAWSRQGKRICILTWEGNRTVGHKIVSGIERADLRELCREIELRGWVPGRLRRRVGDRARELWRRVRMRRLMRGKNKVSDVGVGTGSAKIEVRERGSVRLIRPLRRAAAGLLAAIDRSDTGVPASWIRNFSRIGLSRFLLGFRVGKFRAALAQLDTPVVVSLLTETNLYVLGATRSMNCRVVVSERNDPDLQQIAPEWQALRRSLYREADAVTSNSAGVLEKLSSFVPVEKLKLLPNPVVVPEISEEGAQREQRFITVTRLVHQKGVDLLLKAFSQIAHELPDWTLHIVGDGPLRPKLIAQAERLGVANRVTFHGHVETPVEILRTCRVFVLSSRFEGMPNALLEAMACGLAPIVTDASPGPLECVRPNETGLVVETENASSIAAAMLDLARDDDLAVRLGHQAAVYVKAHDWAVVERHWLAVLGMAAGEAGEQPTQGTEPSYA